MTGSAAKKRASTVAFIVVPPGRIVRSLAAGVLEGQAATCRAWHPRRARWSARGAPCCRARAPGRSARSTVTRRRRGDTLRDRLDTIASRGVKCARQEVGMKTRVRFALPAVVVAMACCVPALADEWQN